MEQEFSFATVSVYAYLLEQECVVHISAVLRCCQSPVAALTEQYRKMQTSGLSDFIVAHMSSSLKGPNGDGSALQ